MTHVYKVTFSFERDGGAASTLLFSSRQKALDYFHSVAGATIISRNDAIAEARGATTVCGIKGSGYYSVHKVVVR